jgi:large repetitive protein
LALQLLDLAGFIYARVEKIHPLISFIRTVGIIFFCWFNMFRYWISLFIILSTFSAPALYASAPCSHSQLIVPVILSQLPVTTDEDTPVIIDFSYLIVSDEDSVYPTDFTMSLSAGENYTVTGQTVIPDADFAGNLTVPLVVNDGTSDSQPFNLGITVMPVNDAPVISVQNTTLEIEESEPLTLAVTNFTVADPDNAYPGDFSLIVGQGENYSVNGNTITPASNFNGTLSIPVSISDGTATSNSFAAQVTVTAVNTVPVITGQATLSVAEEQSLTIGLEHLIVDDPDNVYPTDFTLVVGEGANYVVSGTSITPVTDFNGVLSIPVYVNDGTNSSDPFNLQVTVTNVNDAPTITGQTSTLTIAEGQSQVLTLDNLQVTDPDNTYPAGFSLTVYEAANYTVSGNTITPVTAFNGSLNVPVTVNDGSSNSNTFNVTISVTSVNDPPVITGQNALQTNEESPITIAFSDLIVSDNDDNYPEGFTLNVLTGENYTVSNNTVTPSAEFSGTLSVPVTVNDGEATSVPFNLQVTVLAVNDAPAITGQTSLTISEDQPFVFDFGYLIVTDPDNTYPEGFILNISPGSNYSVAGNTITAQTDYTGMLSVPVTVSDGTTVSNTFTVQIEVTASDDAPVITGQRPLQVNEDNAINISLTDLTIEDPDNPTLEGLSIMVQPGSNYTFSGSTITPAPDFFGVLSVTVVVSDQASGSNPFPLQITVLPVNDPPVITGQGVLSTFKNQSIEIAFADLIVTDVDNQYPNGYTIILHPGNYYSNFGNTVVPITDFVGSLNAGVSVSDGNSESNVFNLVIEVKAPPNVAPVIASQVKLTTYENQPITIQLSHLIVVDEDNDFPEDFTLLIGTGTNYTVSGNTIVPATNFSGMLTVPVRVKDLDAWSPVFNLKIEVLPVADVPLITSQNFLSIAEDDSLILSFADLVVIDPDDNYPEGFSLSVLPGENYTVTGFQVKPHPNFFGYLTVPVTVNDGENNSAPYQLIILVEPVNDLPLVSDAENGVQYFGIGNGPLRVFDTSVITDIDSDTLTYGEVWIKENYQAGLDSLLFTNTASVKGVFDPSEGILVFFGKASIEEYQTFIRNIAFLHDGVEKPAIKTRLLTLVVNDGIESSAGHDVQITFDAPTLPIDVPGGFTPNGDGQNDTWSIKLPEGNQTFDSAVVRVYNQRGVLIFESYGFEREWDGTMNGTLLPAATYFYTIDLHSKSFRNQYKGIVTILR